MRSEMENVLKHTVHFVCVCSMWCGGGVCVCTEKQPIIGSTLALVSDKLKLSFGLPSGVSLCKLSNIFLPH